MQDNTPSAIGRRWLDPSRSFGLISGLGLATGLLLAGPALAQDADPAPIVDKGDVAWMMVSTILVLLMTIPGLALFYGGLVRSKNILSVLTQVTAIVCVASLMWVGWGYSMALTDGGALNAYVGGFSQIGLANMTADSLAATFSDGIFIPEYVFVIFQMTFAAITAALIVGGFAERIKFGPLMVFTILWLTFVYAPICHMVWASGGYLFELGALDFAGGTVVHINSGIAALVGAVMLGRRVGHGSEQMAPHSLPFTMIGAALLWVGWFGFNAGSNLEATAGAGLAMINTFVAPAAAGLAWQVAEWVTRGKPSLLGLASGVVAGLVVVTPMAGIAGPMGAIVCGAIGGVICYIAVMYLKNGLGYDDSLDVFGIHCVGGIFGAIATGVVVDANLGGIGLDDYNMAAQVTTQATGVIITLLWSGLGSLVLFTVVSIVFGLRVPEDHEREGLDITAHGERAYNM
ncbi:MAG: ammonium transporter [Alphaproteobacteria bacterium]|nr:ammonium transporter [Alphaproteobacteria bacterium]